MPLGVRLVWTQDTKTDMHLPKPDGSPVIMPAVAHTCWQHTSSRSTRRFGECTLARSAHQPGLQFVVLSTSQVGSVTREESAFSEPLDS